MGTNTEERASAPRPRSKQPPKDRMTKPILDLEMFKPEAPNSEIVLGTYGTSEWVDAHLRRTRWLQGLSTLEVSGSWLVPAGFKLSTWVVSEGFKSFTFFSASNLTISTAEGDVSVYVSKMKIDVTLVGSIEFCTEWNKFFNDRFKRAENLIRWVYNARGDDISVPLNYRPAVEAAYPWIEKSLSDYIKDYLNSEACVLILIGPPGTGKTTFIKNVIHQSGGNARVAYDQTVLQGDDFFASFVDGEDDVLVMEDADSFLADRQDGNTMMHKFLNVSDGLISTVGKKMIFSTNLPNVSDIDPALMRTGRCFDVVQFRPLTRAEAQAVLDEVKSDRTLGDGANFTLSEIFSTQPSADNVIRRGIGFTS